MVGLVTGAPGKDEALEVEAQEREVADQVEYLVSCAFVVVAQGVSDHTLAAEDQEIGRRWSGGRCRRPEARSLRPR